MTMTSPEPIAVEELRPIIYRGQPVLTTALLAAIYGTSIDNISVNHSRNRDKFVEGKHLFTVTGDDLAELRRALRPSLRGSQNDEGTETGSRLTLSQAQNCDEAGTSLRLTLSKSQISPKARSVILWTRRGIVRHSKMLDTEEAWEVFERLEDFYFKGQGPAPTYPFKASSGEWNNAHPGAYSKRLWEEAERLGLKDSKQLADALGWNKSKLWHALNMNTQPKKAEDFHILIGKGFDLRYLLYGERTFSRAELDLIGAYRASDTQAIQRIAAARPLKILTDET